MSFGFSVSDFLAVGQLSWKVYKKCKGATGNYAELSSDVLALHAVIKETEELFSQQDLNPQQKAKLTTSRQGCEEVLKDLDGLLVKYKSLGTSAQRTWDRMRYGMQDMNSIRLRLIANVSMLDAFNNASSNARLEDKLNLLIEEVRAGKREDSVISLKTFNQAAQDDRETWEALRRELEDIGISPIVITDKRQFIVTWFQGAVAAGQLEEDVSSDDNDSANDVYESDVSETDRLSFDTENDVYESDASEIHRLSFDTQNDIVSIEGTAGDSQLTHDRSEDNGSVPRDSTPPKPLQAGKYEKKLAKNKEKSRFRVSSLVNKFRGTEPQILEAASTGEKDQVMRRLDRVADIGKRHRYASQARLAAAKSKEKAVMRVLLKCEAPRGRALVWAVKQRKKEAVILLTEYNFNINTEINRKGETALIVAFTFGTPGTVRLFLEKGANTQSRNVEGETALILAARHKQRRMVELLLSAGADTGAKNLKGQTAVDVLSRSYSKDLRKSVRILQDTKKV